MQSRMRSAFAILILLFFSACGNTYNRTEMGGTERTGVRLNDSSPVFIMTLRDGDSAGKLSYGSGAAAALVIDASFSRCARIVDI